jgi:hypothetical protein
MESQCARWSCLPGFNCCANRYRASAHANSGPADGSGLEDEKSWDSDDSVCLMEDMDAAKAREMVLLKSVRLKPKLSRMGENVVLTGKDSALMRSKRWVKEREVQIYRDQSDVPVRFKEMKNTGFKQHRFSLFVAEFICQISVASLPLTTLPAVMA